MLKAKLMVVGGEAKATEINLKLPCVIGRGRGVTLTLPHPLVSRRHCEIYEKHNRLYVRDLGSLNGTFINNTKIIGDQVLNPNQLLSIGAVTFRAVYELAVPAAATTTEDDGKKEAKQKKSSAATERVKQTVAHDVEKPRAKQPAVVGSTHQNEDADPQSPRSSEKRNVSEELDAIEEKETVYDDEAASSTDKSLNNLLEDLKSEEGSGVGASDVLEQVNAFAEPEKSVSISSLDSLPTSNQEASFAGGLELEDGLKPKSAVESISLQVEEPRHGEPASHSEIESFVKKLPR